MNATDARTTARLREYAAVLMHEIDALEAHMRARRAELDAVEENLRSRRAERAR